MRITVVGFLVIAAIAFVVELLVMALFNQYKRGPEQGSSVQI